MKKYITIDKKYLLIPVCAEKELKTISISCQGEKIYEFNVPVKESRTDITVFTTMLPLIWKNIREKLY